MSLLFSSTEKSEDGVSDFKQIKYIFETPEGAENKATQWKTEIMNAIGQVIYVTEWTIVMYRTLHA